MCEMSWFMGGGSRLGFHVWVLRVHSRAMALRDDVSQAVAKDGGIKRRG